MRSTRRLNKPLLPRGAGRRGQGYERNKKQRGGGGTGGEQRGEGKKSKRNLCGSIANTQKANSAKKSSQSWRFSSGGGMKVNLKINNPFPAKGQRTSFKWRNLSDRVCHKPARKRQQESAFYFFPRRAPLQSRSLLYWATWEQDHWKCDNAVMNGPVTTLQTSSRGAVKRRGFMKTPPPITPT